MNPPKISVLIPTYNYARFLAEAIESVLAQDFQDFELLVVDDCSADNTAGVVRPFCARDPRVHFAVNSADLGMARNWNQCLEQARGEYIKLLFGDDKLFHPQALSKLLALMDQYPSAVLAASARTILDEKSNVVDVYRDLAEGCHEGRKVITACLMENGKNLVGEPSAVLFRKSDARRGFDAAYRQVADVEMWFNMLEKGTWPTPRTALRLPLSSAPANRGQHGQRDCVAGARPVFLQLCRPAVAPAEGRLSHSVPLAPLPPEQRRREQRGDAGVESAGWPAAGVAAGNGPMAGFASPAPSPTLAQPEPFHPKAPLSPPHGLPALKTAIPWPLTRSRDWAGSSAPETIRPISHG